MAINPSAPNRASAVTELFARTCDLAPGARAEAIRAAGTDDEIKNVVEFLLSAHDRGLLHSAEGGAEVGDAEQTVDAAADPADPRSSRIGRYKLLQTIGEGGFGTVYMAEQEHPIRRQVALKIIKAGMDTRGVIARFEAERQALAMMDHPNIAKVLDAGATPTGRPYFVMELVRGIPVTEYCDQNNLSLRERLELFVLVCQAVQHAHQKGIIHRDLKPGNVLITMHDGKPVPKVIDFGIAKATQGKLTDKTLFTEFRQFMGTPAYMSPEQAEMSGLDIDTRGDVYSLGVMLYELLTGSTPFDPDELRSKGHQEMLRVIREVEPPKPSTRLGTLGAGLSAVAARRRSDALKLGGLVRGELDWIAMKCLAKDRTRRYESASALAIDVERHLKNEAVLARPTTAAYRIRKFVGRHTMGVAAAAVVALALFTALGAVSYGLVSARRGRAAAVEAKDETVAALDVMTELLKVESRPLAIPKTVENAMKRLDEGWLTSQPQTAAAVRSMIGLKYIDFDPAVAEEQFKAALELLPRVDGRYPPGAADALAGRAKLAILKSDSAAVDKALNDALAALKGDPSRDPSFILSMLQESQQQRGNLGPSQALRGRAVEWEITVLSSSIETASGNDPGRRAQILGQRGRSQATLGRFEAAADDLRKSLAIDSAHAPPRILLGYLALYFNKEAEYRECTKELLGKLSKNESMNVIGIAMLCLLDRDPADLVRVRGAVQSITAQGPPGPGKAPGTSTHVKKRFLLQAMLDYRDGRLQDARQSLSMELRSPRIDPANPIEEDVIGKLILAMCCHRLNDTGRAKFWLESAVEDEGKIWPDPNTQPIKFVPNYLAFQILKREAESLIEKPATRATTGPR